MSLENIFPGGQLKISAYTRGKKTALSLSVLKILEGFHQPESM
jgi:hypothetical protein